MRDAETQFKVGEAIGANHDCHGYLGCLVGILV